MAELLLELLSEEIPARMQLRAAEDLGRLIIDGLATHGLELGNAETAQSYVTPRRLTFVVTDLPARSSDKADERRGPRVGAPEKAINGFLKAAGLKSIKDADVVSDPKKGDYYLAKIEQPGRPAADIVADVIPTVLQNFPWPKSMRWGAGDVQWVRPLHAILCIVDGKVVPFEFAGIKSGNTTVGHRFHTKAPFKVTSFENYGKELKANKVLLPSSERREMIAEEARDLCARANLALIEDEALLKENAGLVEWPVVLMGEFDESFLTIPQECLTTSLKTHQKCFSLKNSKTGKLANRFILVSNLVAKDGGKTIVTGNEKVIHARLTDAKFFWEQDLARPLDEMALDLEHVTFHERLGSQKVRVERIAELAGELADKVDAPSEDARRAAQLCKADLMSEMVGEFPELQGVMGRYYAKAVGTKPEIAAAIAEHYKPKGPNDDVPQAPVSIAVALADKIDTLVGFWAINEKPTGSGDPYQLRRAALGIIRTVLENDLRLHLAPTLQSHLVRLAQSKSVAQGQISLGNDVQFGDARISDVVLDLLSFFADRLKVYLRDRNKRHDLIDAVFALPGQDDLALMVNRVEALSKFLGTEDGENLLAGVKRANSILRIEEKKDGRSYNDEPKGPLLKEPAERDLAAAIAKICFDTSAAIDVENFEGAMRALAELRRPVDTFFDDVTVNSDDPQLRENRLKLLNQIRATTLNVADFSKIAG